MESHHFLWGTINYKRLFARAMLGYQTLLWEYVFLCFPNFPSLVGFNNMLPKIAIGYGQKYHSTHASESIIPGLAASTRWWFPKVVYWFRFTPWRLQRGATVFNSSVGEHNCNNLVYGTYSYCCWGFTTNVYCLRAPHGIVICVSQTFINHSELLELRAPERDFENGCPTVYFPQPSRSTRCPKPRHPNQAHLAGDHVQDED